jgi:hypothetical protein
MILREFIKAVINFFLDLAVYHARDRFVEGKVCALALSMAANSWPLSVKAACFTTGRTTDYTFGQVFTGPNTSVSREILSIIRERSVTARWTSLIPPAPFSPRSGKRRGRKSAQ